MSTGCHTFVAAVIFLVAASRGAVHVRFHDTSIVPVGATATLSCSTDGNVTHWTKGAHRTILADSRFKFSEKRVTLVIFNVRKSDEGTYYCHVQKSNGVAESGHGRLDVLGRPTVQALGASILEGNKVVLSCRGLDFLFVLWKFNGTMMNQQLDSNIVISGDFGENLTILNATRSYNGTYNCSAVNRYFTTSAFPQLIVNYPPSIVSAPINQIGRAGFEVSFECNVSGNPQPSVSWMYKNENLDFSRRLYITSQKGSLHTLTIETAENTDSGLYTCLANNQYGSALASAQLTMEADFSGLGKPTYRKTVLLASNATLLCPRKGFENEPVKWKKDQQTINFASNPHFSKLSSGVLVILRAGYNESGVYQCSFTMSTVQESRTFQQEIIVTVRGPPSPVVINSVILRNSEVYVKWSAPWFDGHSPIIEYKVCIKCGDHLPWVNSSFPSSQHSATIPCLKTLGHVYIVVVAVNNHGQGESTVQEIHIDHPPDHSNDAPITTSTEPYWRGTTGAIDVDEADLDSNESDSFGIGPLLGVSVVIGLVIAGIVLLLVILIRRKTDRPATPVPTPQKQAVSRLNSDCVGPQEHPHRESSSSAGSQDQLLSRRHNTMDLNDVPPSSHAVNCLDNVADVVSQTEPSYNDNLVHRGPCQATTCQRGGIYETVDFGKPQYSNVLLGNGRRNKADDIEHKYSNLDVQVSDSSHPSPKRPMLLTKDRPGTRSMDELRYLGPGEDMHSVTSH